LEKIVMVLTKISCFLKPKMIIKGFFKINSYPVPVKKFFLTSISNFLNEKCRTFSTFCMNLHTGAGAISKSLGSGSSKKLLLHRLRLRNTACEAGDGGVGASAAGSKSTEMGDLLGDLDATRRIFDFSVLFRPYKDDLSRNAVLLELVRCGTFLC
jgi:hypothetical protein